MDTDSEATLPTCAAPFASMEFDPTGAVNAYCANTLYPLGRVADSSLREIWRGDRARKLRQAVAAGRFSLGCTICSHRIRHNGTEVPILGYAHLTATDPPDWPERLSFALHNTCNLECVMCGADRSSRIRSHRAGLPPLPHVYGRRFFEELDEFLEHATYFDFVGGEPFLVREHWTVWDRLAEIRPDARCAVTTNGTVWNDRVERVLDQFDTDIRVSLDARSPDVFESIRVGSDFAEVMSNFDRFRDYASARGTTLSVSFSLIRHNWFELADMLTWAEQLGVVVGVQTVMELEYGIQHLPDHELEGILAAMRTQGATIEAGLDLNRAVWDRQLLMIETELRRRHSGERVEPCFDAPAPGDSRRVGAALAASLPAWPDAAPSPDPPEEALRYLADWGLDLARAGRLGIDESGRITSVDHAGVIPDRISPDSCPTVSAVLDAWCDHLEGRLWVVEELARRDHLVQTVGISGEHRDGAGPVIRLLTTRTGPGQRQILVFCDTSTRPPPVPVTISVGGGET